MDCCSTEAACNAVVAHAACPNLLNLCRILQHIIIKTMRSYRFSRILSRRRARPAPLILPLTLPLPLPPPSSFATQLPVFKSWQHCSPRESPSATNCCQLIQFVAANLYCDFVRHSQICKDWLARSQRRPCQAMQLASTCSHPLDRAWYLPCLPLGLCLLFAVSKCQYKDRLRLDWLRLFMLSLISIWVFNYNTR